MFGFNPPGPPRFLQATPNTLSATLSWTAPATGTVNFYVVLRSGFQSPPVTATTYEAIGLAPNALYSFIVLAVNNYGSSSPAQVITTTLPLPPTSIIATPGETTIGLRWTPPAGSLIGYRQVINGSPQDIGVTSVSGFVNLTRNTSYAIAVFSRNVSGLSATSTNLTSLTLPGPPTNPLAVPRVTEVTLSWTPPAGFLLGYTIYTNGSPQNTAAVSSFTVTGLTAGTNYTFLISARNNSGNGPSTSVGTRTLTLPTAPTSLQATVGLSQVSLTWAPPLTAGSNPITAYRITSTPSAVSVDVSANVLAYTATSLLNTQTYVFSVAARTSAGQGPAAATSALGAPDHPIGLSWIIYSGSVVLSWNAPVAPGIGPLTGYRVSYAPSFLRDLSDNVLTFAFTGLTNNTAYTFGLFARNTATLSPSVTTSSITPRSSSGVPATITSLSAALNSSSSIRLSWLRPSANDNPIINFTIKDASSNVIATLTNTSYVIEDLEPGSMHSYRVLTSNAAGTSQPSALSNSITIPNPSLTITAAAVSGDLGTVQLSWTKSGKVFSYEVTTLSYPSEEVIGSLSTLLSTTYIGNLTPGLTYRFQVELVQVDGSISSTGYSEPLTIPSLPGPLTDFTADSMNNSIMLSWFAPANGVTSYHIRLSGFGFFMDVTPNVPLDASPGTLVTTTIPGLTTGIFYSITAYAQNAVGQGPTVSTGTLVLS